MNILIYCPDEEEKIGRLMGVVRRSIGSPIIKICHDLDQLFLALRQYDTNWDVFMGLISSNRELDELNRLDPITRDLRLILILMDQSKEIIENALRLRPSFFTDYQTGMDEVYEVLSHLSSKHKQFNSIEKAP